VVSQSRALTGPIRLHFKLVVQPHAHDQLSVEATQEDDRKTDGRGALRVPIDEPNGYDTREYRSDGFQTDTNPTVDQFQHTQSRVTEPYRLVSQYGIEMVV
jgi:hypothetical protein